MPWWILHDLPEVVLARPADKRSAISLSVLLKPDQLTQAATRLKQAGWFLEDLTALQVSEGFEVDYYFAHWERSGRVALRLLADAKNPSLPSLCAVYPGAEWHEREAADFFGLEFPGNPNPMALLLDEDAPRGPLCREKRYLRSLRDLLPQDIFIDAGRFAAKEGER